jgi:cytochrome c-type biogenesis protein CcmH
MRVARLAALLGAALVAGAAPAAASAQTSLADLEDEVMCPICGTLLELSTSPQAERQRVFVARLVAEGRSKAEIKDALVAEYGPEVLAEPPGSGFDLSAYLVPVIAFLAAAAALALALRRWRRGPPRQRERSPGRTPNGEDAKRLEADIARYDL